MGDERNISRTRREERTIADKQRVLDALEQTLGIVTSACKATGVCRKRFYEWLKNDEEFRNAVDEIQNVTLDYVEDKLFTNVKNGDTQSIIYYLKCKGEKRGYGERREIKHSGNGVVVQVTDKVLAQELVKAIDD